MLTEKEFIQEVEQGQQLEQRWIMGGDSLYDLNALPKSWQPLIESLLPEQRILSVLALVSQQKSVLAIATEHVTKELTSELLPELAMPILPDNFRFVFRKCLESLSQLNQQHLQCVFLRLIDTRGYISHPFDWMPKSADDAFPEIYWPWVKWLADVSQARSHELSELTDENWSQWLPAERLALLKKMRVRSPEVARLLVEKHSANESSDKRLKLIETLAVGLSESDVLFLKSLLSNRSKKVIAIAQQFLSRISQLSSEQDRQPFAEILQELSQVYEIKQTGLIRKKKKLIPKKLKSSVQKGKRTQAINTIPLAFFAEEFGLTVTELANIWDFDSNTQNDNLEFFENAAHSMSVEELDILLINLLNSMKDSSHYIYWINRCVHRFSDEKRELLVTNLLANYSNDVYIHDLLFLLDQPLVNLNWAELKASVAWKTLITDMKKCVNQGGFVEGTLATTLQVLGLYLPFDTAKNVFQTIVDTGINQSDPALMYLKFNAQLEPCDQLKG